MSTQQTWISLPQHVLLGGDAINSISTLLEKIPTGDTPLLVTSPTPRSIVGEEVTSQCTEYASGVDVVEIESASFSTVTSVVDAADAHDLLIGVGGGKVIDVTKLASEKLDLPYISIPTTASHDGIASARGSIPDDGMRHSVAAEPPLAIVADTSVISKAPWELTTAGCADIISNYSAVRDWELANRLKDVPISGYAAGLSRMTAEMLVENASELHSENEYSAWFVLKALISSGVAMSIAGSSRPASGSEHLISHRIDSLVPDPALHGHQVGVASILTMYLHGGDWEAIRDALTTVGAPITLDGLGISEDVFVEAVTSAHTIRDRETILSSGMPEPAVIDAIETTNIT